MSRGDHWALLNTNIAAELKRAIEQGRENMSLINVQYTPTSSGVCHRAFVMRGDGAIIVFKCATGPFDTRTWQEDEYLPPIPGLSPPAAS